MLEIMDGGEKDKNSSAGMLSCYLFISRYFMQLGSCLYKSLCIRLHTVCPRNLYPFYTVSFCSILYSKLYYKMDKYFLDIWYYIKCVKASCMHSIYIHNFIKLKFQAGKDLGLCWLNAVCLIVTVHPMFHTILGQKKKKTAQNGVL